MFGLLLAASCSCRSFRGFAASSLACRSVICNLRGQQFKHALKTNISYPPKICYYINRSSVGYDEVLWYRTMDTHHGCSSGRQCIPIRDIIRNSLSLQMPPYSINLQSTLGIFCAVLFYKRFQFRLDFQEQIFCVSFSVSQPLLGYEFL